MKFLCSRCLHVEDSPAELTDRPIIIATLRCTLTFQLFENIKIMEIVKLINWHQYMSKYQVTNLKFVQEIEYNIAPSPPSFLKIWNLKSSKWNSWPKVSVPLDLLKKKIRNFDHPTVAVVDRKWNILGEGKLKVVCFLRFPNDKLESNNSVLFLASQSQPILVPVLPLPMLILKKIIVWACSAGSLAG